jgi:adenylate cyclase
MRLRSPIPVVTAALVALGALLSLARHQGLLQFLELAAYDLMVAALDTGPEAPPIVTLVVLTERDIQTLGNWPFTDAQLQDILTRLLALDPAVLGLDIYRDLSVPPGGKALGRLLGDDRRIVAIEKFPEAGSPGVPPPPTLHGSDRVGFSDLVSDPGGVIRRNLLFQSDGDRTGFSFSLRLALAYLGSRGVYPAPGDRDPSHMRLGEVTLTPLEGNEGGYVSADAAGYQIMLDFHGGPLPFPTYSLGDLMQERAVPEELRDRIVILGVASESVKDRFVTPFAVLDQANGTLPGAALHAHAAQQLVDTGLHGRQPLRSWSDRAELAWLWLWIALGFLAGWFAGPTWRFLLVVAAGAAIAVAIAAAAYAWGWWIPVVPNLLGWLTAAGLSGTLLAAQRRRDQLLLMSLFARQVSPQVAETIWQRRDEVLDEGKVRPRTLTVTTLFTDLQGFTRVSEQMEPEPFLEWLNSYFAVLTDNIMDCGGVLDDYAGDGIKANFGVPINDPARTAMDAQDAVHCALALGGALTRLNREWKRRGRACMGMRIGIHTGRVVVGTVGSSSRMKYTTVGRNVNLASRLECLREAAGPDPEDEAKNCRIFISAETAALVADAFVLQEIGSFELKGISAKTPIFQVIGEKP